MAGRRAACRNIMTEFSQILDSSLISSNSKKKSSDVRDPWRIVHSLRRASSTRCGLPNVSRNLSSKADQDEKSKKPSLISRRRSLRQLEAPPLRNVREYLILDSAVGNVLGWESKILLRELRKFSVSLMDPSKNGGSAILTFGPL